MLKILYILINSYQFICHNKIISQNYEKYLQKIIKLIISLTTNIHNLVRISDTASISSSIFTGSSARGSHSTKHKANDVAQELQEHMMTRTTPLLIKKFGILMLVSLVITLVLIGIETKKFYNTSTELVVKIEFIENFYIRFELIDFVANSAQIYNLYRQSTDTTLLAAFCQRTFFRANRLQKYNYLVQKNYEKIGINYDKNTVKITDGSLSYYPSLYYFLNTYLNSINVFLTITDYDTANSCIGDYTSNICNQMNSALDYATANGNKIRDAQLEFAAIIIHDLMDIANSGKITMYTIISICIGIVLISSGFLFAMLIYVIKSKSRIMSIFAEILEEDISKIIEDTKSVAISTVHFKNKFLSKAEGSETLFWKNVGKNLRHINKANKGVQEEKQPDEPEKEENNDIKENEISPEESKKLALINEDEEQVNIQLKLENEIKLLKDKKYEKKRQILSRIDSKLRNSSVFKLLFIMISFLLYGSGSLYFNYKIYYFNEKATQFFYILASRNVEHMKIVGTLRGLIRKGEKYKLYYSPNPIKEPYFLDTVDSIYYVEKKVQEYKQFGDRKNFPRFFALMERADSSEMCDVIDEWQVGQVGKCADNYGGPMEKGLAAGIAYMIDFHILYSQKAERTDFENSTQLMALITDPRLSFPGVKITIYLQSALEQLMIIYRIEATEYYEMITKIVLIKGILFGAVYMMIYLLVLSNLLNRLKHEIWLGHGFLHMIPPFVLHKSAKIQQEFIKINNQHHITSSY